MASSETNEQRAERLLDLPKGSVVAVGTEPHPNGVTFAAVLKSGGFAVRVAGREHWDPPPLTVKVRRQVVGEKVVGQEVAGREPAGQDAHGKDLFRDVMRDVLGPALEGDDVLRARAEKEALAAAAKKGWRRVEVLDVALDEKGATVTLGCG